MMRATTSSLRRILPRGPLAMPLIPDRTARLYLRSEWPAAHLLFEGMAIWESLDVCRNHSGWAALPERLFWFPVRSARSAYTPESACALMARIALGKAQQNQRMRPRF